MRDLAETNAGNSKRCQSREGTVALNEGILRERGKFTSSTMNEMLMVMRRVSIDHAHMMMAIIEVRSCNCDVQEVS